MKTELYVDMDGTLTELKTCSLDEMKKEGFFRNLQPNNNVIDGIEILMRNHPEIDVNILTAVFDGDNRYIKEKEEWIEKFCPFLKGKAIFIPVGSSKRKAVTGNGIKVLLDDYSHNLKDFSKSENNYGIKLLNGKNGSGKAWHGDRIKYDIDPDTFAISLYEKMIYGIS